MIGKRCRLADRSGTVTTVPDSLSDNIRYRSLKIFFSDDHYGIKFGPLPTNRRRLRFEPLITKSDRQISPTIRMVKHQPASNLTIRSGLPARRAFAELHSDSESDFNRVGDSESVFSRVREPDTRYQGEDKFTK